VKFKKSNRQPLDELPRYARVSDVATDTALLSREVQYKEEAEEAKRTVLALEKRVVALESELVSPANPQSVAVELAETKGRLDAALAELKSEKNKAVKTEGRAERVAKLERDAEDLRGTLAASNKRVYAAYFLGLASGAATAAAVYQLLKQRRA